MGRRHRASCSGPNLLDAQNRIIAGRIQGPLLCCPCSGAIVCLEFSAGGEAAEGFLHRAGCGFLLQVAGQVAIAIDNAFAYRADLRTQGQANQEKLYFEDEIRSEMNFQEIVGQQRRSSPGSAPGRSGGSDGFHGPHLWRDGQREGTDSARGAQTEPAQSQAFVKLNCAAIPQGCWKASSSATRKGPLPGRWRSASGDSNWLRRGPYFWMKSGKYRWSYNRSCCVSCRSGNSSDWAARARCAQTPGSLPRPIAICTPWSRAKVPLRFVLPVKCFSHPCAPPARADRRYPIPGPALRPAFWRLHEEADRHHFFRNHERARPLSVAGKYSRAAECDRARGDTVVGQRAQGSDCGSEARLPEANGSNGVMTLEEMERRHILSVLEQTNWVFSGPNGAAARLGMKRPTSAVSHAEAWHLAPASH